MGDQDLSSVAVLKFEALKSVPCRNVIGTTLVAFRLVDRAVGLTTFPTWSRRIERFMKLPRYRGGQQSQQQNCHGSSDWIDENHFRSRLKTNWFRESHT